MCARRGSNPGPILFRICMGRMDPKPLDYERYKDNAPSESCCYV